MGQPSVGWSYKRPPVNELDFTDRLSSLKERARTEDGIVPRGPRGRKVKRTLLLASFLPWVAIAAFAPWSPAPDAAGLLTGAIVGGWLHFVLWQIFWEAFDYPLYRRRMHPVLKQFFVKNATRIGVLEGEIAAFKDGRAHFDILGGKTKSYEVLLQQCEERRKELQVHSDAIVADIIRLLRQIEDGHRLQALKERLPALLPSTISARLAENVTPYVALLEAQEHIERTAGGLPLDGSLPKDTATDYDLDRE